MRKEEKTPKTKIAGLEKMKKEKAKNKIKITTGLEGGGEGR